MGTTAEEIQRAVLQLGFTAEQFRRLTLDEAEHVYQSALRAFVAQGQPRWWWEHFTSGTGVQFVDGDGWQCLAELVPVPTERVWFIADDDDTSAYSVWDARVCDVQAVIAGCYAFEYYLIQQQLDWLLCENHHNVVIAVGAVVEERLCRYGESG